jgi:hypothetical protein
VDIAYSSPGVKGRKIWGGLVPYDSLWRTGANNATTITFSTDVMIGGTKVKQGEYALFTIPGRDMWTVILNTDYNQFGAFDYKKSLDAVRIMVKPETSNFKERMAFMIDDVSDSVGRVSLCWENLKVSFDVSADTRAMIAKNLSSYYKGWDGAGRTNARAAVYSVEHQYDLKAAEDMAKRAISIKEDAYNCYAMAMVLKAEGNNSEALKYANKSKTIGEQSKDDFMYQENKEQIAKLIEELNKGKK